MQKIRIADRYIGANQPCFIIAEAGSNHNHSLTLAKNLIAQAKEAGADAVKFQTFTAKNLYADLPQMTINGRKKCDYLSRYELPYSWHRKLYDYARKKKICFLSTPFDEKAVDFLDRLGIAAFKISSFELTHFPLLAYVAAKHKPVILSTGMANLGEIKEAIAVIRANKNQQIALLHCSSVYPVDFKDANLKAIQTLRKNFSLPVGFSDHTLGIEAALAACAIGAKIIEKHFTLNRRLEGPDHKFSLQPDELRQMVEKIRNIEQAQGTGLKRLSAAEKRLHKMGRRSIFCVRRIKQGQRITPKDLAILRPNFGLAPKFFSAVCRKRAKVNISPNTPLTQELLF